MQRRFKAHISAGTPEVAHFSKLNYEIFQSIFQGGFEQNSNQILRKNFHGFLDTKLQVGGGKKSRTKKL